MLFRKAFPLIAFSTFALALFASPETAVAQEKLFAAVSAKQSARGVRALKERRVITVGPRAARDLRSQKEVVFNFPGRTLKLKPSAIRRDKNGQEVLSADLPRSRGEATFVFKNGNLVSGSVVDAATSEIFQLIPVGSGRLRVDRVSAPQLGDCAEDTGHQAHADAQSSESPEALQAISQAALAGDVINIDLLVMYSPQSRAAYGGTAGIVAHINQAIAETNQAYIASGVNQRVTLVHAAETAQSESGSLSTDLNAIRASGDGMYDEAHSLRNQFGADLVTMIIQNDSAGNCGIGSLMTSVSTGFASSAFSVVRAGCATGNYSFAHELGHNMGIHHDRDNATSVPAFPYAYGWRFYGASGAPFRDLMSYNAGFSSTRILRLSNPDVLYDGVPTGVSNSADNALALNNTAATVAAFRGAPAGACVRGQSSMSLSPASQSSSPGVGKSYSISIRNNDSTSCAPVNFNLSSSLASGLSASFGANVLQVSPGLTSSTTVSVVPSSSAAQGSYGFSVSSTDGTAIHTGQASGELVVQLPDVTAPSAPASLRGTVNSAKGGTSVSLAWNAATDDRGVAGYRVFMNGSQVGQTSSLAFSQNLRKVSGSVIYTVRAFDAAGNLSPQSNSFQAK